ncbi:hypothetical protein chiPu_0029545, partial [Chiloscyllium punctatum]|nr:hypothetical protein [Chiloscyllium punctatum]
SGRFPGEIPRLVWEIPTGDSWACLGDSHRRLLGPSGRFQQEIPGPVWDIPRLVWEIPTGDSQACLGDSHRRFLDLSGSFPGEIPGPVWEIPGEIPRLFGRFLGRFPGLSGRFLGRFPGLSGRFPGEIPRGIWDFPGEAQCCKPWHCLMCGISHVTFVLPLLQPRAVAGFRGTVRYASVNAHKNRVRDCMFMLFLVTGGSVNGAGS